MFRMLKTFVAPVLAAMALSAPLAASAQSAAPLKFKWGLPSADYYAVYVARDQGLFKEAGLDPEFFSFASGAPLLAGLKSESLDVITTGLATVFALGQNIPLKMIYWELDHAAAEGLVVDPKSGIKSVADLPKAKAIGAPSGTCAQVSMVFIAKKLGVKYNDLSIVNIAPPLYGNAFASGAIQAGIAWSPYSASLEASGYKIANWAPEYTPEGGVCPGMTAGRPDFLAKHPDLGLKLVQIKARAMEMIQKNPQLGIDALVKYVGVPKEVAKASFEREFSRIPTLEQQVDPKSPFSMTAPGRGLALKFKLASEALAAGGSIPAPLTDKVIADAIDPSYILRYLKGSK
ncbi:MAG TPA: ABC transporter substrate-binding protein [Ramlibacter sp.]|uniref:ABC transporter substrate-binding protein n=1 Tax=Ramlibacter sp. TaxID=1917967 RepID=UPI002C1E8E9E|nr:ABC transporter substrate-binding protein [Ramlibacter sp.]HVZ46901.1 ABC transporter substrate-binding protein [Ramlibacter sp.]